MQSLASTREWSVEGTSLNVRTLPELYRKWEFRQRASLCSMTWVPFRAPEMNRREKKKNFIVWDNRSPTQKFTVTFCSPLAAHPKRLLAVGIQQEYCTIDGVCLSIRAKKKEREKENPTCFNFLLGS